MPRSLAFPLFSCFVLALLWIDRKRAPTLSPALWIPTLWMIYCASRPVSQWFHVDTGGTVSEGNPIERSFLGILIIIGFFILQTRRVNWSDVIRNNRWLIILFAYMLISIVWSDFPFVSFKRYFKTAGSLIMALIVLSESSPYEAISAVFRRIAYTLVPYSVLLVKYFREFGRAYGRYDGHEFWKGVTTNKNSLGVLCMVSAFFLIWALVRRREGKEPETVKYQTVAELIVLAMTFWLLRGPGGAYSATSILTLIVGLAVFFTLRRYKEHVASIGKLALLTMVGVGLTVVVVRVVFGTTLVGIIAPLMGRNATLTGRTDVIWNVLIPMAKKNPILGVGYGAFWVRPIDFDLYFTVNEAHNGYLDVFIELGAVGLILLPFVFAEYFRKTRAEFAQDFDRAAFRMSFLFIMLLHNITETSFLRSTELLWNVFVFMIVILPLNWSRQGEPTSVSFCEVEAEGELDEPEETMHAKDLPDSTLSHEYSGSGRYKR